MCVMIMCLFVCYVRTRPMWTMLIMSCFKCPRRRILPTRSVSIYLAGVAGIVWSGGVELVCFQLQKHVVC